MGQAQQDDNPAKPLLDLYKKWTGKEEKKPAPPKQDTSWHDEQVRKANDAFAKSAQEKQQPATPTSDKKQPAKVPSYKKGGKVKKTGLALLHKGEKVITKKNVKRTEKAVRKYKR
jgi:hypothetical protein